jgi:hypothetical protein
MKRRLLFAVTFLCAKLSFSQLWVPVGSNDMASNILGNVGIGLADPAQKLHVAGNIKLGYSGGGTDFGIEWFSSSYGSGYGHKIYNSFPSSGGRTDLRIAGRHNSGTFVDLMTITSDGYVGIGTTSPGSYKLAVEGKIGARELKVTLANPWPDYVFKPEYKLMGLRELKKFLLTYSHLPDIPSAANVQQSGGFEIGDMSTKLLKKVEELTLYIIQLNEENEKIRAELTDLKSAVSK